MKLIHRFAYYFGGFSIGIIILLFFLGGKKTSCDYGPNARVTKNICSKKLRYSVEVIRILSDHSIDTSKVAALISKGKVDFDKSNTKSAKCNTYVIENRLDTKKIIAFDIENCDSIASVNTVVVKNL